MEQKQPQEARNVIMKEVGMSLDCDENFMKEKIIFLIWKQ